jgi:hypothetical protein
MSPVFTGGTVVGVVDGKVDADVEEGGVLVSVVVGAVVVVCDVVVDDDEGGVLLSVMGVVVVVLSFSDTVEVCSGVVSVFVSESVEVVVSSVVASS